MLQQGIRPRNSRCFSFYTSLESLDFLSSSHKTALTEGRRQYQHPLCQSSIWNLFRGRNFHFLFPFVFFPLKAFICHLFICLFFLWFPVLWANTAGYQSPTENAANQFIYVIITSLILQGTTQLSGYLEEILLTFISATCLYQSVLCFLKDLFKKKDEDRLFSSCGLSEDQILSPFLILNGHL